VLGVTDSIGRKPVHYASASMTDGNLIALVERGAELRDIDRKKFTSLMIASYHGLDRNVEYILEKVRDPNFINFRSSEGYTALHYAILNDHIECVRVILNDPYFIEVNEEWKGVVNDMFSLVAGTGNQEIFELLKMKFKGSFSALDRCDGFKRTPTMLAIRNHNNEILYSLLDEGCKHTKCDST
jgi:ankyrin repeat protein